MVDAFADRPYLLIPNLIPQDQTASFLNETAAWPERRVSCGMPDTQWTEQSVPRDSALFELFSSDYIVKALHELLRQAPTGKQPTLTSWISRYQVGEYINDHCDRTGDIQIVLAIGCYPPENGGLLCVDCHGCTDRYFLCPGDALVFRATEVRHHTTPLIATQVHSSPERVVAVARYTF
jgi:hypothetical protein